MLSKCLQYLRVGLVVGSFLLLASLLFAAFNQTEATTASEKCIRCHIATFNQGIQSRQMHTPFWERQCTVCHLPAGSNWGKTVAAEDTGPLTGTVVSQQNLWRKLQSFSAQTGSVNDHLISLQGLDSETAYRFRILLSPVDKTTGGDVAASLWIGLRPKEVADLSSAKQLEINDELSASLTALGGPVSLYRSGNTIFISWATTQPLFGWVELQQL
jgi:predicted CXXCH cytochrome family protein